MYQSHSGVSGVYIFKMFQGCFSKHLFLVGNLIGLMSVASDCLKAL
jgi:hypothetical protein